MALCYPSAPCSVCGKAIGEDNHDIIGFDAIEIPEREFQHFCDSVAHISCLSCWDRRDEFVQVWNRALSEYFAGKWLLIGADGRVGYTDSAEWRIQQSLAVQQRQAEHLAESAARNSQRREDLLNRMEAARRKAIHLGLASPRDVDRIIRNMPPEKFLRHFGEFNVSRAFFKDPPPSTEAELRSYLARSVRAHKKLTKGNSQSRFHYGIRLCNELIRCLGSKSMEQSVADQMWNLIHEAPFFHPTWYNIRASVLRFATSRGLVLDGNRPFPPPPPIPPRLNS